VNHGPGKSASLGMWRMRDPARRCPGQSALRPPRPFTALHHGVGGGERSRGAKMVAAGGAARHRDRFTALGERVAHPRHDSSALGRATPPHTTASPPPVRRRPDPVASALTDQHHGQATGLPPVRSALPSTSQDHINRSLHGLRGLPPDPTVAHVRSSRVHPVSTRRALSPRQAPPRSAGRASRRPGKGQPDGGPTHGGPTHGGDTVG